MVNIIICGPAGAGKTSLIKHLREVRAHQLREHLPVLDVANKVLHEHGIRCRNDYNCSDENYLDVQRDIIQRQHTEESALHGQDFITDNCIINALVLLDICVGEDAVERVVEMEETKEIIERYKESLVVFVGPVSYMHDDQKSLILDQDQWDRLRDVYQLYFLRFHIPFLDLRLNDMEDRISKVKNALKGTLPLASSTLSNYDQKIPEESKIVPTNFLFHLKNEEKEDCISIPTIEISEHFSQQTWTSYTNGETNRFIMKEGYERLICLKFDINVKATVVQKMLLGGIYVNGCKYSFLGCSGNGLKTRKCFMYKGCAENVEEILKRNGDFNNIKTVSKRIARIGLLFSGVTPTKIEVKHEDIIVKGDIMKGESSFNFTDGCGGIGKTLAKALTSSSIMYTKGNYLPSVYQIRFQGYKGVLAVDDNIPEKSIMVRPSMKKFDTNHHPCIGLCDYSKPYTFGHLNKQYIILLSGRGIKDGVFEDKQAEYIKTLENMLTQSEAAVRILQWQNMFDIAQEINRVGGLNKLTGGKGKHIKEQLGKLRSKLVSKIEKLHILIPESRNIFGVCDPYGILNYGECFLRLTISDKATTIRNQVVVCKNPCYLLGDLRILTAISDLDNPEVKRLNHLVDCIVFPTRGKRPHPNEIAGSDLDGDCFFVTWDKHLIPNSYKEPYDYPGTASKAEGNITNEKIISYFSRQNETQKLVGRVDSYFNRWADLKGPGSSECELLGQLFSKVIDSCKTGENIDIPRGLQPTDARVELNASLHTFIWTKMMGIGKDFKEKNQKEVIQQTNDTGDFSDISEEFVYEFAQEAHSNISAYEKFQFLWMYEKRQGWSKDEILDHFMSEFADHIQFSHFTMEERRYALDAGIPLKVLLNDLNRSKIVLEEELNYFQMDSPLNTWTKYVTLEHSYFDWSHLIKALTTNDYNLLIFKMPDDVVLELQILEKLTIGREQPISPGTITGLLYSRNFGYKFKYILGKEYVLDLTEDTFQLYRNSLKNLTFVWLNATDRKQVRRRWNKSEGDEIRNALSVDLQRFNRGILNQNRKHPLINKAPFVTVEMYAQNCTGDVPYWDIYDANDLLPVTEEMTEPEEQGVSAFKVDFESVFKEAECVMDLTSEEQLHQALREISVTGNPFAFKSAIEKWFPRVLPTETVFPFIEMLQYCIAKVVPEPLPENIKQVISEVTHLMSKILVQPEQFLIVVSQLIRLKVSYDTNDTILTQISSKEYLEVLDNWQSLVYLDIESAVSFAEKLLLSCTAAHEGGDNLTVMESRLHVYIRNLVILHLLNFIVELHEQSLDYRKTTHEQKESCISNLRVNTTAEKDPSTIFFYKTGAVTQNPTRFRGQYVVVSRQNINEIVCTGQIESINTAPCTISVKICGKKPEVLFHAETSGIRQYWRINLIGNIVLYQRVVKAFKNILSCTALNDIFTKIVQPSGVCLSEEVSDSDVQSDFVNITALNENQNTAVKYALSRKVSMILGPPGTGKTEVACRIVRQILNTGKHKCILVVAETNVAVDNLTRRLRNHVSVVRIGPNEGVDNDLYEVSLEGQMARIAEKEAKRLKIRDQQGIIHDNTRLTNKVLAAADVILTTCSGAGDVRLDNYRFPFVLVDEATQTLETTLLCSLTHGAEHLVLIGDPKQLGPVVKEFPKGSISPNLPDLGDLSQTLFHRWSRNETIPYTFLDIQHRMHPDIMKFPSEEFYEGKLKAAASVCQRLPVIFPWPTDKPLCFVNVNGRERMCGTSYYNKDEIEIVERVIDVLLNVDEDDYRENRLATHHIGVITLYQGQVQKLKEKIKTNIKISTVDGFQGQEMEVIVVSTVRCNDRNSLGFSDDPRRLNVLFTRAKRGLVVIGNKSTLMASTIWAKWLKSVPVLHTDAILPVGRKVNNTRRRRDTKMKSKQKQ